MDALPSYFSPLESLPWESVRQAVELQRASSPEGKLFVDRLLDTCLGPGSSFYPPQGPAGLRLLLKRIAESESAPTFLRRCLEFYLVLDFRDEQRTIAFLAQSHLPFRYTRTIAGYHLLDEGRLPDAVKNLVSAGDDLEYLPHIITRLALDPQSLVTFIRLGKPVISDPWTIFELIRAFTLEGGVNEAWRWMRKLPLDLSIEPNKTDGLRLILSTAFGDNDSSRPVPASLQILLSHPFEGTSEDEAVWAFCNDPPAGMPGKNRDVLVSWAVARLAAEGRHGEALALLQNSTLAPTPGEATAQRQLLRRGLESVLSKVHTAVDSLLKEPDQIAAMSVETDVDLTATPWAEPQLPAPMSAPKSLLQAKANEEQRSKKPMAPTTLPPSATPQRKSIVPTSASPFRPSANVSFQVPAQRVPMPQISRRVVSPKPPTSRLAVNHAPSPRSADRTPSIPPLGPRRPPEAVVKPASIKPVAPSPERPSVATEKQADSGAYVSAEHGSVKRTKAVAFPGAFGIEEDAMEEDLAAESEPPLGAPLPPKRKTKATRSKTASNLASLADDPEPPSPARATRKSKTMTGLSALDKEEEQPAPETVTPRRSKRLSVQPRTASPEVPKTTRSTKKGGKSKA